MNTYPFLINIVSMHCFSRLYQQMKKEGISLLVQLPLFIPYNLFHTRGYLNYARKPWLDSAFLGISNFQAHDNIFTLNELCLFLNYTRMPRVNSSGCCVYLPSSMYSWLITSPFSVMMRQSLPNRPHTKHDCSNKFSIKSIYTAYSRHVLQFIKIFF